MVNRFGRLLPVVLFLWLAACDAAGPGEETGYTASTVSYTSSVLGGVERPLVVALPPDYESRSEALPVLYLLHGWGGSEQDWTTQGNVLQTLSEGHRSGDVKPMIVVMPNNVHAQANPLAGGPDRDGFLREIREDIIPYIESNYRASSDRADRAIAGLSAGGVQTLNLTLFYPQLWRYSFPMSTAYFPQDQTLLRNEWGDSLAIPAINDLAAFELAIAPDDLLFYELYKTFKLILAENHIQFTTYEAPGGHTWAFWSAYFEVMAPRLFR